MVENHQIRASQFDVNKKSGALQRAYAELKSIAPTVVDLTEKPEKPKDYVKIALNLAIKRSQVKACQKMVSLIFF